MDPLEQELDMQDHQVAGEPITIIEPLDQWSAWRRNLTIQTFNEWRILYYVVYFTTKEKKKKKKKILLDVLDLSFINCAWFVWIII